MAKIATGQDIAFLSGGLIVPSLVTLQAPTISGEETASGVEISCSTTDDVTSIIVKASKAGVIVATETITGSSGTATFTGLDEKSIYLFAAYASKTSSYSPPSAAILIYTDASCVLPTATSFDTKWLKKVQEILSRRGKNITYYLDQETYDIDTGSVSVERMSSILKSVPPYNFDKRMVDGQTILSTDLLTGVAARGLTFDINAGTKVSFDCKEYVIQTLNPYYAQEKVVYYEIHLTRA